MNEQTILEETNVVCSRCKDPISYQVNDSIIEVKQCKRCRLTIQREFLGELVKLKNGEYDPK